MFERLLFLFNQGRLDEEQLQIAVNKTWITEEEKQEIIASKVA